MEILKHLPSATCLNCEAEKECLEVRCTAGTFAGPLCAKCLFREAKKRGNNQKLAAVAPPSHGSGT